ncbi:MAG: DUF1823 family protein [Microcoleaceae cyanobacterium]
MTERPPLTTETIWDILNGKLDDTTVNQLVWNYLGYCYNPQIQAWEITTVESDWREDYPEPPDFINSRPATVKLTRSIPQEHKQLLKEELGFQGYKIGEFSPTQARRATAANWLLSKMKESQT